MISNFVSIFVHLYSILIFKFTFVVVSILNFVFRPREQRHQIADRMYEGLQNEMNPSNLRTPEDANSDYMMINNKTTNNTSVHGPVYIDYEFLSHEME